MQTYLKPSLNSYTSCNISETIGPVQTNYPVQFTIQAIEFQLSQNQTNQSQTVYTAKAEIKDTRNLA